MNVKKNKLLKLVLIGIVLAIGFFLIYGSVFYFKNCESESCFDDYLRNCKQAQFVGGEEITYKYKILGSDGINKLTGDTQKLMLQQQKLFDTMQNMTPMIQQAKDMLSGIDMNQLGGLADMANSLGVNTTK